MLKKLSSRRGFTIVEVMVAFVIFAIMAGMVGTILSTTMRAKQENIDVEEEIAAQKQAYYQKQQPMSKDDYTSKSADASNYTGTVSLDFQKASGSAGNVSVQYVAADPTGTDDSLELEYYIGQYGNDSWKAAKTDPEKVKQGEDSVLGGLNCGIYGSNGIMTVKIGIDSREVNGKTRYYVCLYPEDSGYMNNEMDTFAQLRIKFPSEITSWGYINQNNGHEGVAGGGDLSGDSLKARIDIPSDKTTIRVVGDGQGSSIFQLTTGKPVCWIELASPLTDEQLNDMTKLFGTSGKATTSTETVTSLTTKNQVKVTTFQRYTMDDKDSNGNAIVKTYINVFAATEKPETPDPDKGK